MSCKARSARGVSRRQVLSGAARLAALGVASHLAPRALAATASARLGTGPAGAVTASPPPETRLVLLGTQGGPNVNVQRAQAASAIVVDGHHYLVDCGYGSVRSLVAAGLGYQQIDTVFLTHLHDDHTSDIPALLTMQWTGSKAAPTTVYGPHGTEATVAAALAFLKANADIRIIDEGRTVRPDALYRGRDIAATATPAQAFADDRVKVSSVENTHFPSRARATMPYRSLCYRFDTPGRSIVFSGDTAYSPALVSLARGADLFVCEVIDLSIYDARMAEAKAAEARGITNSLARHIVETHSTTVDAGRMAKEAGVKTLVLSHLVPGANGNAAAGFSDADYVEAARKHFDGEVIVGRDQMVL